jgi:hypothetical protein
MVKPLDISIIFSMKLDLTSRVLTLFLCLLFSWQASGAFPTSTPKTCCGRTVCLCTHAKGAPCPFKGKAQARKSCHLHQEKKSPAPPQAAGPRLNAAPCHKNTPPTLLPSSHKDYEPTAAKIFFYEIKPELLFPVFLRHAVFLTDNRLDQPPRFF